MKIPTPTAIRMPLIKIGLTFAIAMGLAHVQAAPNDATPASGASSADLQTPAKAPGAGGGHHKHRKEVTRAPVSRPVYPSNPLPPVPQRP